MIFVDYPMIGQIGLCLMCIVIALLLIHGSKDWPKWSLYSIRFLASCALIGSGGILLLDGCGAILTTDTVSTPLYSPNGRQAIRVTDNDGGAGFGYTFATLHWNHGLASQIIVRGHFQETEVKNLRWASDRRLFVGFDSSYKEAPDCRSTRNVQVICQPLNGPGGDTAELGR